MPDDAVFAFVHGELPPEMVKTVEQHLSGCPDCRSVVAETARFLFQSSSPGPRTEVSRVLASGTRVSRYVIGGLIGVGAAGVVYRAHDPQLRRKIALKLMRPDRSAPSQADAIKPRLLREARAMAQLSHRNVVTVFDVGTYEDQIFIVMELVEGETLAHWMDGKVRPWEQVVRAFTDAGKGLAAAHAVQIVHRDFKPANVLVGSDGRVLVTDFGLAHPMMDGSESEASAEPMTAAEREESGPLATWTATEGGLVGTPIFMAPEQFLRRRPDVRTDQFSFCVALYMALYGRHPFATGVPGERTLATLSRDVVEGKVQPPPVDSRVPGLIFATLARGLEVDPMRRFASMEDLLGALEVDRDRRSPVHRPRSPWIAALVAPILALAWALSAARASHHAQASTTSAPPAVASPASAMPTLPASPAVTLPVSTNVTPPGSAAFAPTRAPDQPVESAPSIELSSRPSVVHRVPPRKVRVAAPNAERKRYEDGLKDPF